MSEPRPIDIALGKIRRSYTPGPGRPREDVDLDPDADADPEPDLDLHKLTWPPPPLEHLHGLLGRITTTLYFAALLLIAALALPRGRTADAGSWGTVVVFIVIGIILFAAYMWLMVLFNRAATAVGLGYPRALVWHVATDSARNTAQILRGSERYERFSVLERSALLKTRVTASFFALAGALWLTLSMPLLIVFTALGRIGSGSFWPTVLVPAVICFACAVYFRIREVRVDYGNRIPDEEDRATAAQARGWRSFYNALGYKSGAAAPIASLRIAAAVVSFAVFIMLLPIALAAFTTVVPQLLPSSTTFYAITLRVAALQPLRTYRLPFDSSITPLAAGEAYHRIVMAGGAASPALRAAGPLNGSEMATLARASEMDFAGGRWTFDASSNTPPWRLEPTGHRPHAAAVAYAESAQRSADAELKLREIISAGFLIADESMMQWDATRGASMVQYGAERLAAYYRENGKAEEAEWLAGVLNAASSSARSSLVLARGQRMSQGALRRLMRDPSGPRANRWDAFLALSTSARCGSLGGMLFGPGRRHAEIEDAARQTLVRYPAEHRYFVLASRGFSTRTAPHRGSCDFGWLANAIRGY